MNEQIERFDLIFSYWIFAWYLLFIFKYTNYSPKLALLCALLLNSIFLVLMIIYNNSYINILLLFCIIILFKIIPLFTLRNSNRYDVIATLILFFIYNLWLYFNGVYFINGITNQYYNIINNKEIGPVTYYFNKMFNINK